jgi:hypothetical protein
LSIRARDRANIGSDVAEHALDEALAEQSPDATPTKMGRRLRYPEKREAAFAEGTLARIQLALKAGETQAGFIRAAVEAQLVERDA